MMLVSVSLVGILNIISESKDAASVISSAAPPSIIGGLRTTPSGDGIDWTLLVWMANDNSPTLPWQDDIDEMLAADTNASIVVLYDGNGSADSRLFSVKDGSIDNLTANFFSTEINTGSPFQLSDFVVWGMENYPSRHVWVDLCGHGNGWKGMCRDIHPSDLLTPSELGKAFKDVKNRTGRNVDILTFDACRMGAMSVIYDLQGSVDYVLSSEKDVPDSGLPYTDLLNNLSPSPEESAHTIVDKYVLWASVNSAYSVTYSATNMSLFPSFMSNFNAYIKTASSLVPYRYADIWKARNRTETYEAPAMYDLRDFIGNLKKVDYLLDSSGSSLLNDYNRTFFEMHYSNPSPQNGIRAENAGGMSIYFPIQTFSDYTSQNFYSKTEWGNFLATIEKGYNPGLVEMAVNYSLVQVDIGTRSISLNIETESNTTGQSATAYLLEGAKLVSETNGFPNITIRPERLGNYSIFVYLWRNGSLYAEKELKYVNVTAVLKLYGQVNTTSGKAFMGRIEIDVRNLNAGKRIVLLSNGSDYSAYIDMPSFCNIGDTLEMSVNISGEEVVHTITVSNYSIEDNFMVPDEYGNNTDNDGYIYPYININNLFLYAITIIILILLTVETIKVKRAKEQAAVKRLKHDIETERTKTLRLIEELQTYNIDTSQYEKELKEITGGLK